MADLDLATRLADHNQFCAAKRRLYAPLAGLCWILSYAIAALVASLVGLSGAVFHAAIWLALAGLAVECWWQVQAYAARDAQRVGIAAGTVAATASTLAARRGWARRGLLPAAGPDPLRAALRVLCAAPRLSASAWHAPQDALPWTHGDLARAQALLRRLGADGGTSQPVAAAGEDADLVPGLEALGVLEVRLGEAGGEVRIPHALWQRHFAPAKPERDVFVVPEGDR
jgi:hypothetical protein